MRAGRIGTAFENLSDRERKLVVGGGALVFVSVTLIAAVFVSRKVAALEEDVSARNGDIAELLEMAPDYLAVRAEDDTADKQLTKAADTSLQSTLLSIAKEIEFEKKYVDVGGTSRVKLSDYIKFENATEVLAELTKRARGDKKRRRKSKRKKKGKDERQVFLATIDVSFDQVPDTPIYLFMSKLENHPDRLFGVTAEISRQGPNREQFRATLKVGQFRYGGEESS
jgi:type II secretory pathway component PulM